MRVGVFLLLVAMAQGQGFGNNFNRPSSGFRQGRQNTNTGCSELSVKLGLITSCSRHPVTGELLDGSNKGVGGGFPGQGGGIHGGGINNGGIHNGGFPGQGGNIHGGGINNGGIHNGGFPGQGGNIHGGGINNGGIHGGGVNPGRNNGHCETFGLSADLVEALQLCRNPLPDPGTGPYKLCSNGHPCCCVDYCDANQLPNTDGSGLLDLRIVNNGGTCHRKNQVYCCQADKSGGPIHGGGGHKPNIPSGGGQFYDYCGIDQCCCVPKGVCGGGPEHLLDLRITNGGRCKRHEEYCCDHSGGGYRGCGRPYRGGYSPGQHGLADYGEYPWQVAILTNKDGYSSTREQFVRDGFVAGGVIIDEYTVLSVGHRLYKYNAEDIKIRVGDWDVTDYYPDKEIYESEEYDLEYIYIHPGLNIKNAYNDLAILKLRYPIRFSPTIGPVCLPEPGQDFSGQTCWTTGWGKDAKGKLGQHSPILKEVDLPIFTYDECDYAFKYRTKLGPSFNFNGNQFICAGGVGGKDACTDDGGGPLVCEYGGKYTLAGLVAWGKGCGEPGVPGAYVKVSNFLDWIYNGYVNGGHGGRFTPSGGRSPNRGRPGQPGRPGRPGRRPGQHSGRPGQSSRPFRRGITFE